uniref:Mab-21 domain containing 2 n=1 Tax=Callorhinchus milii TaxID=7868 RepID=A0A4W3GDJ4_CALMI
PRWCQHAACQLHSLGCNAPRGRVALTEPAHSDPRMVQKLDQKLPVANEYLLLSGGVREGVVDMDQEDLSVYARGTDYDMDFTLLVPALKLHDRNQPVTLDMRHSTLCHSWLSLRLFDEGTINKWKDCCTIVEHINGASNYFFSPTKVADWFYDSTTVVLGEIQRKPQRGMPRVEQVEKNGTVITVILGVGSSRMLYDIIPVVSFKGWPAVAQSWLMDNHFWDGKITEEEVISGFYLVPACSFTGKRENEWRLSFARSEVQLKKCISSSLMQGYQACKAIIMKLLSRPKAISPYHLRSMMLWACDRLPATFLVQDEFAAHFLLGLIDDLQHCLVNRSCPNYFIPQCNMFEHLSDQTVILHARKLSSVRSDPTEHLRTAIEHVKAANRLTQELQRRGSAPNTPSPQSDGSTGDGRQPDDRLAKKLQQLVTENPGKSISVFINPDDVTRPHFRIDDKFF